MKLKIELITAIIFLLSGVLLLTNSIFITQRPVNNYILRDTVFIRDTVEIDKKDTLSIKNVYKEILRDKIQFPRICLQQVLLETNNLVSDVCLSRHNLFGFTDHNQRIRFHHWQESVQFYKDWQSRYYGGGNYYNFLKRYPYCGDTMYIRQLKLINIDKWLK